MKKFLLLLTCIIGIGATIPTSAQAWDRCRTPVYRGSYAYPVYQPYYNNYGAYRAYPVRNTYYRNSYYNGNCGYYPRYTVYRPRVGVSFFFIP